MNSARLRRLCVIGLSLLGGAPVLLRSQGPVPQFRAGVDLVRVEVQVVDREGSPIDGIPASSFDVRIDGRRRQVRSADFVRDAGARSTAILKDTTGDGPRARNVWPEDQREDGRTFVLAFDETTLSAGDGARARDAGRAFIDRLSPSDAVGVVGLPHGAVQSPTKDRRAISAALGHIGGHSSLTANAFHLSASEIFDISMDVDQADAASVSSGRAGRGIVVTPQSVLQQVQTRECRSSADTMCLAQLVIEVASQERDMEERAYETFAGLGRLLRILAESPGRKTVVLMSGGMPVSDRWLQNGGAIRDLGRAAALANSTVYAIHIDTAFGTMLAAETRTSRPTFSAGRERDIQQKLLTDFALTSGGALFAAPTDGGHGGLARVLLETSAMYVLGVTPDPKDLDGRPHELKVGVSQKGVTLRSVRYVVLRRN